MTRYYVDGEGQTLAIDFEERGEQLEVRVGDDRMIVDLKQVIGPSLFSLIIDNQSYEIFAEEQDGEYGILIAGELFRLQVQDEWARRLANIQRKSRVPEGEIPVRAPMPGVVLAIEVAAGERVAHGQGLVVLGAMKMENQIKSPRDGTVKSLNCEQGQTVEQGRVLVVLE